MGAPERCTRLNGRLAWNRTPMTDTKTSALTSITPDAIAPAADLVAMVDTSGGASVKTPIMSLRGKTKDVTGLSPYTISSADAGALLVSFDTGTTPYSFIFPALTDVDMHARLMVEILAPSAGANFTASGAAAFYNGSAFSSVGAATAGVAQVARFDLMFQTGWQASNVAYGTIVTTTTATTTTGTTTATTSGTYTYWADTSSSYQGYGGGIYALDTVTQDVTGETIPAVAYAAGTSPDYGTWTYVAASSANDITTWKSAAYLAFDEQFATFSRFSRTTGAGFWDIGSTTRINNETEVYPLQALITSVGDDPFSVSNNVLTISCKALNSGYSGSVITTSGEPAQAWQSGRADSSLAPGGQFYAESGTIYLECVMQVPDDPAGWPAFWAIAADGVYPIEHDVIEVFGDANVYDATTHFQDAAGDSGSNNSMLSRIFMANGYKLSAGFHKFGALINYAAGTISNYFDDHLVGTLTPTTCGPGFQKDIFLILNLATGGFVASPTATTVLPIQVAIRQVRVYYGAATGGYGLVSASTSYSGTQAETTAYLAACTTAPTAAWTAAFNTMILAAKNLGFFDTAHKPLHWWIFATGTQQAALIDVMNPTATALVMNGTLTWTANRGFKGPVTGSATAYLETGVSFSGQDVNNFQMQAYITDLATTSYSGGIVGTSLGSANNS
ncbi:MAG: glycoside hydrolase family 16 protein, partial [Janthinobacterium lividum]